MPDLLADNDATHKHRVVLERLAKHPRFVTHFTSTSVSRLNMVEWVFRDITLKAQAEHCINPACEGNFRISPHSCVRRCG